METAPASSKTVPPAKPWFARPPRLWSMPLMILATAHPAYARSAPPGWVPCFPLIDSLGTGLGLLILLDLLLRVVGTLEHRVFRLRQWRWYVSAALGVIFLVVWCTQLPLRIRFHYSRVAFEAAAVELLQTAEPTAPLSTENTRMIFTHRNRRIGSYPVEMTCAVPSRRAVFFVTGGFFRGGQGFVYNPAGHDLNFNLERRDDDDIIITEPLTPGWMTFKWATP